MKIKDYLLIVILSVFFIGCQSPLRKYDGVLGYKVVSNTKNKVSLLYTDEDRRSWSSVKKRATIACKHQLKNGSSVVSLTVLNQEQFVQQVEMAIRIPVASAIAGGAIQGHSSEIPVTASPSNNNQTVMRQMKLKRLLVECYPQ